MSVVVQDFTLFLSTFVIAFVVNWKLASVISTLLPVMFITFYIIEKVIVVAVHDSPTVYHIFLLDT